MMELLGIIAVFIVFSMVATAGRSGHLREAKPSKNPPPWRV